MMSLLNELRIAGLGLFTVLCLGCSPGTDKTPGKSIGQNNESSAVTLVDASRSGSEAIRPSTVRASTAVGGESTSAAEFRKPDPASVPFDAQKAAAHQKAWADHLAVPHEFTNSVEMKFVIIPPGNFQMGSPADEPGRDRDEFQHLVGITKPFYIGVYEVAQAEFKRVTGRNPSYFCPEATGWVRLPGIDTSTFPVERVSWKAAVEFCEKLSSRPDEKNAGRMYRLPTEAEWEFACRAGTETPFHFGWELNGTEANIRGDRPYGTSKCSPYLDRTAKVGSYQPNAFGVFDMHGNVWEWCSDWYAEEYYLDSPRDNPIGAAKGRFRVAPRRKLGQRGNALPIGNTQLCRLVQRGRRAGVSSGRNSA